jgi:hypothetical protein
VTSKKKTPVIGNKERKVTKERKKKEEKKRKVQGR